jgi:acyl-CoA reductase-like NAD-dependent aldehyde dehydrogenase
MKSASAWSSTVKIKAVGFAGSQRAGKAIFDACARRPEAIPVHAEMGSFNPIFILPEALRERGDLIAEGLLQSNLLPRFPGNGPSPRTAE